MKKKMLAILLGVATVAGSFSGQLATVTAASLADEMGTLEAGAENADDSANPGDGADAAAEEKAAAADAGSEIQITEDAESGGREDTDSAAAEDSETAEDAEADAESGRDAEADAESDEEAEDAEEDAEDTEDENAEEESDEIDPEYDVELPDGYDEDGRAYPVIYLLPEDGYSMADDSVVSLMKEEMATDQGMDMILVRPAFTEGMDIHAAMDEIISEVDEAYSTIDSAAFRTAAGVGVGGYLAYVLGFEEGNTAPDTFKNIVSIRGDFVSDENPWYETYGSVQEMLEGLYAEDTTFYHNYYTYMDAPVSDVWTNMSGSTADLSALFINWEKSIAFSQHEFTLRFGNYDSAFLKESASRVIDRLSNIYAGGMAQGSISLDKAALTADVETADVNYSVTITDDLLTLLPAGNTAMQVYIRVTDPSTKEVLAETADEITVEGVGVYSGEASIANLVNDQNSTVTLSVKILGVETELATAKLVRIQSIGEEEDEQLIDLMGDWYFNYVGRSDPYTAVELTEDEFSQWSVVQPALASWEEGFGNITQIWWRNIGWGWYARTFEVPENFTKENLTLSVGYMDDRGEVYVNGVKVGYTGVDENGNATGDTTWAVYSYFDLDPAILNYGGTNTIYVHCYNDPPYGGGGWYSGPVGIYSQAAFNKSQGLPSTVPSDEVVDSVTALVKQQNESLTAGDFDAYAKTVSIEYFASGVTKDELLTKVKEQYSKNEIASITDNKATVYETNDGDISLYLYTAERTITYTDGSMEVITYSDSYAQKNGKVIQYGDHSRFFEESYESAYAASAAGLEGTANERYLVYLPEGYFTSDKNYPTVYLLHQYNSDHTSYITDNVNGLMDEGAKEGMFDEMIVIIPNSAEVSFWRGDWEKMVTDELVDLIDSKYRTIKDARYRLTAGASMGGQGAYGVALRNPDVFSGAVSFFGAFSMGGDASPNKIAQEESAEYMNYFALYFMCGNQDLYGFGVPAIDLDQILQEKNVDHYFFIENGDHNSEFYIPYFKEAFSYVRSQMYQSSKAMERQVSGGVAVRTYRNSITANTSVNIGRKIRNYLNTIPVSSYTEETTQALNVTLKLEVVQDGEVVYTDTNRSFDVTGSTWKNFKYDLTDAVDQSKDYTVTWKAYVLDREINLDSLTVRAPRRPSKPGKPVRRWWDWIPVWRFW